MKSLAERVVVPSGRILPCRYSSISTGWIGTKVNGSTLEPLVYIPILRQYIKSLDGLRAIAVGIVILAHSGSPIPRSGGIGVDIFFVLSGFLITGILSGEYQKYGSINRKNFYIRRFLRLFPALLACVLFLLLVTLYTRGAPAYDVALVSLTYTTNYARALFDYDMIFLGHFWSLAIEEQYYLIWPMVVIALERISKNDLKKCFMLMALAFLLGLYRFAMVGTFSAERIYFGLDTHMDGIVMGSSLSYLYAYLRDRAPLPAWCYRVNRVVLVPLALLTIVIIMYSMTWRNPWMGRVGYTLVGIAACVLIFDLVAAPHSYLRAILENSILVYLGRISYGLYLYHYIINKMVLYTLPGISDWGRLIIVAMASIVVSALSFHLYESKFLKLKNRFGHRSPKKAEVVRA